MDVRFRLLTATLALCTFSAPAHEHDAPSAIPASAHLGTVSFENSCKAKVKGEFNRGIALLHSFWLDEAERVFKNVISVDPDCSMAYWGEAMSHTNQVNGGPALSDLAPAREALAKADAANEKDAREAAYIQSLHHFVDDYKKDDFDLFANRYTEAMASVATDYPNDLEAQIFYALALLNSQPPGDVVLVNARKAVEILNPILREHPDHPGVAHYIIHASDNPQMANDGLEAAHRYASIAPAAPHALHMPSHIFARLGLWQDDIRSNLASKVAAEKLGNLAGAHNRLHAMEFLEYAYLQMGDIDRARAIVTEAKKIKESELDPRYFGYYATVQTRFRYLLSIETQDWKTAASITPRSEGLGAQGLVLLAHAISAAHLHDEHAANETEQALNALILKTPLLQRPTASLPGEVRAWVKFAQGDVASAIALLRPIADREEKIGKGEVELPTREMLAEMSLMSGQPKDALREYQTSLTSDPNRFNALLGAAQAAEQIGERTLARQYYHTALTNSPKANGIARDRLEEYRALLD